MPAQTPVYRSRRKKTHLQLAEHQLHAAWANLFAALHSTTDSDEHAGITLLATDTRELWRRLQPLAEKQAKRLAAEPV